jgi:hypothetical protein
VISPATGAEWRGEYDRVSKRDRLKLTPDLTTRWATRNDNFVYSSLWDFKSSFTCNKILRHGTFPLYFPSERKVCWGFLSPLKIHRLGRVLNPQPLGPVASTLITTPPRRRLQKSWKFMINFKINFINLFYIYVTACLVANFKQFFGVISHLFNYIESQYFSYLARDPLNEVICGPHVKKSGDPWSRP